MAVTISKALADELAAGAAVVNVLLMSGAASTLALVDGGAGVDTLTDSANGLAIFHVGDKLRLSECTTAANNGSYTITAVAAGTLSFATGSWTTAEAIPNNKPICSARGHSVRDIFKYGEMRIYSGTPPAMAATESGTLLLIITESGGVVTPGADANGLLFGATAVDGLLSKDSSQTWQETSAPGSGIATYGRLYTNAVEAGDDAGEAKRRLQFTVASNGSGDLTMGTSITTADVKTIDSFDIQVPLT